MTRWIALIRGINVGGKNIVPMKELRGLLEGLGFDGVKTYIQSGNCVFRAEGEDARSLTGQIAEAIDAKFGFKPDVLVLTAADLAQAINANPYPEAIDDPKTLHLFFLAEPASNPSVDAMDVLKTDTERYTLTNQVFYLHAPDGIGRSKLAAKVEALLNVPATARNLRSAMKIRDLVEG